MSAGTGDVRAVISTCASSTPRSEVEQQHLLCSRRIKCIKETLKEEKGFCNFVSRKATEVRLQFILFLSFDYVI